VIENMPMELRLWVDIFALWIEVFALRHALERECGTHDHLAGSKGYRTAKVGVADAQAMKLATGRGAADVA
jgi:hypothetical protein